MNLNALSNPGGWQYAPLFSLFIGSTLTVHLYQLPLGHIDLEKQISENNGIYLCFSPPHWKKDFLKPSEGHEIL